ncbi:hypothetical protein MTO96_012264 [Rhipicephalus appendiculatus]
MQDMLRHFENHCTFHSVECLRCGEPVLHRELSTHYMAGCTAGVSPACTDNTSSESTALTIQDVRKALEEVKTMLRDSNYDQALPRIQSQVNELTEHVRNQEYRLAEITREAVASVNAETAQHAATGSSTSRQNLAAEASTPTSSLSCSQEMLLNQRPELFFSLSPLVLEQMQKTQAEDYPQHAIEFMGPPNDPRRMHRFRDHPIEGVNWRLTRFVDEVPSSGVCGLCRMIPKRIVMLPCLHTLCQSCKAGSSEGTGGRCPLDEEPFEEAECVNYYFPTRKANALKVHCWNEAHGREFEGAMEFMLRHYEKECAFHTVECLRCGEEVLHTELSTHYVAECGAPVSLGRSENGPTDSQALTLQDVTAALEDLKTLLRDANHEQLLLALQSQMNELIEQMRDIECRPAVQTNDNTAPRISMLLSSLGSSYVSSAIGK